jgi:thiamine biosynthesis lipoprotein
MSRTTPLIWGVLCCGLAWAASGTSAAELQLFEQSERHMGTAVTIKLYANDEAAANRAFFAAFQRVGQLDRTLSDYNETSELFRLSAAAPTAAAVPVSDDLWRVLFAAQAMAKTSDGAFDVTVGPLTKLWRRARRQKELPSTERLTEARAAVGVDAMQLNPTTQSVSLLRPNMRLDLGGIGQGYAADEALAVLKRMGITRATVDVSGDIAYGDPPPNETGWKTGIAPLDANAPPSTVLTLSNCAISTSGDDDAIEGMPWCSTRARDSV